ncbi:hypothetical protein SDC9_205315 [bioreactor metagenome]|uniref:Uncharacterized protein n=1 Tax=bioreactor metagenome TaxID=1076179 RepID=A0A645J203_9ZZZZ
MLQGNIQVMDDLWLAGHDLNEMIGHITGVCIEQAYPGDLRDPGQHGFKQGGKPIFHAQIVAIISGVLGNEVDLFNAPALKLLGIADHQIWCTADQGTFNERNGAKSAGAAATIGDLQIGAGTLYRHTGGTFFICAKGGSIWQMVTGLLWGLADF